MNDPFAPFFGGPRAAVHGRRRRKPEAQVQKQIVQWLLRKGVVLAITDAGAMERVGLNFATGIPKGWGDITGCLPTGRFLMVECKAAKGRQSPGQKLYQAAIEKNGGLYILAHSLPEFLTELRKEEILNGYQGFPIDDPPKIG